MTTKELYDQLRKRAKALGLGPFRCMEIPKEEKKDEEG